MFRTALTMAAIALIAAESPAQERPVGTNAIGTINYPPSPTIKNLIIHPERTSIGNGDNWPITWADDGHHCTVYCDGEGFGGGSGNGSMSLARIVGEPSDFSGENLTSPTGHKEGGGPEGRKASGLLMVEGDHCSNHSLGLSFLSTDFRLRTAAQRHTHRRRFFRGESRWHVR